MKLLKIIIFSFLFLLTGSFKAQAAAFDYDLAISAGDLSFSKEVLISGDKIRIYAKVRNVGTNDISGYISFFRGSELIGNSQAVSVLPNTNDDVFIDFTVPEDSFNIQAKIQGTDPADQNPGNDASQSKLIVPDKDTDGDGIVDRLDDDDDNDGLSDSEEKLKGTDPLKKDSDGDGTDDKNDAFPLNNKESLDSDGDGKGNNADQDDDNDGWSDSQEQSRGTDPIRKDTDGDGVIDPQDFYPLDSKRSVQEADRNIFQPAPADNQSSNEIVENINQEMQTAEDLQNEIDQLRNPQENKKAVTATTVNNNTDVKAAVYGLGQKFFSPSNPLVWLFLAMIMVAGFIGYLFLKGKGLGFAAKLTVLPTKPLKATFARVSATRTPVVPPPAPLSNRSNVNRQQPKVIDLKNWKKD